MCTRSEHKKKHPLVTFIFWEHTAEFRYKPVMASQRIAISHVLQYIFQILNFLFSVSHTEFCFASVFANALLRQKYLFIAKLYPPLIYFSNKLAAKFLQRIRKQIQ